MRLTLHAISSAGPQIHREIEKHSWEKDIGIYLFETAR
jgi:hypothetical protein